MTATVDLHRHTSPTYNDIYNVLTIVISISDDAVNVAISGVGGITGGDVAVGATGGGQHFPIMQPNLGMQYIIALQGYFPSRN